MIQPEADYFPSGASTAEEDTPVESRRARDSEEAAVWLLVQGARSGDSRAQTELVQRYRHRIAGFARGLVREHHAVNDVTQTVFIKMFQHLNRVRDASTFESWLFTIARNTAVDFIRRIRCRPDSVPLEAEVDQLCDPNGSDEREEILAALQVVLKRLSPLDRRLVSGFVAGESYRTIAAQNGCTVGSVKLRLHRVRPFLRASVGEMTGRRASADAGQN